MATRYRCSACGNVTRFDVVAARRTRAYFHYSVGGELTVEDEQLLEETVELVRAAGGEAAYVETTAKAEATKVEVLGKAEATRVTAMGQAEASRTQAVGAAGQHQPGHLDLPLGERTDPAVARVRRRRLLGNARDHVKRPRQVLCHGD